MCAPTGSPSGPCTVVTPGRTVTRSPVIRVIVVPAAELWALGGLVGWVAAWATAGAAGVTASAVTAATTNGTRPVEESVNGAPRLDQRLEVLVTLPPP